MKQLQQFAQPQQQQQETTDITQLKQQVLQQYAQPQPNEDYGGMKLCLNV